MYKEDCVMLGPMLTSQHYKYLKFYEFIQKLSTGTVPALFGYGTAPFPSGLKLLPCKAQQNYVARIQGIKQPQQHLILSSNRFKNALKSLWNYSFFLIEVLAAI